MHASEASGGERVRVDRPRQQACVVFRQLTVNSIENSSGVFIGTNHAPAWSSIEKSNQGFGSLTDSVLKDAVNSVFDTDAWDMSVRDANYAALSETPNQGQQCAIDFGSIHANTLSNGSAIGLGDNKQLGWRNTRKNNYGSGKNLGSNVLSKIANYTLDNDVWDTVFQMGSQNIDTSQTVKNIRITHKPDEPGEGDPKG